MKIFFIVFFVIDSVICFSQKTNNVIQSFYENKGFCGNNLLLYNDSTYLYEAGCELHSYVNYGNWRKLNDTTVELTPIDTSKFKYIKNISKTKDSAKHNYLIIKISDVNNDPIYNFLIAFIPYSISSNVIAEKSMIIEDEKGNILVKPISSDSLGIIKISDKPKGLFKLLDMYQIFHRDILINFNSMTDNLILIQLNLPKKMFNYNWINWTNIENMKIEDEAIIIK